MLVDVRLSVMMTTGRLEVSILKITFLALRSQGFVDYVIRCCSGVQVIQSINPLHAFLIFPISFPTARILAAPVRFDHRCLLGPI